MRIKKDDWLPYKEYAKRKRAQKRALKERRDREADEALKREQIWDAQSKKLLQAKREHPVAYLFGKTSAQQEMDESETIPAKVFGSGQITRNNPNGTLGFFTSILLIIVFFPLLLLSNPRQLPALQIISVTALVIEIYRYKKGKASKNEWKMVLGAVTAIGWLFLLSSRFMNP